MSQPPIAATPFERASGSSSEIKPLTGIRGIAAFYVVLFHFFNSWVILFPDLRHLKDFSHRGSLGVDLFFILSGFILYFTYDKINHPLTLNEYRRFLWNRLARVYPNHLATLALLGILVAASHLKGIRITGGYPTAELPYQLTMTHAWAAAAGLIDLENWNYPSWSISAEWFAYMFMFPLGWWLIARRHISTFSIPCCLGILAFWEFLLHPALVSTGGNQFLQLLQVSFEFLCGGFLFKVFQSKHRFVELCNRHVLWIFSAIIAILLLPSTLAPFAPSLAIMCFPFLLLGLTTEDSILSRFLASDLLVWSGKISYAVYMSHAIVLKSMKVLLPWNQYEFSPVLVRLGVLAANVAAVILSAALLYYLVEIPSRNFLRRRDPAAR